MNKPLFWTVFLLFALAGTATALCPTGNALEFDGDEVHVLVPDSDSISVGNKDYTICAWVRPESMPTEPPHMGIVSKIQGTSDKEYVFSVANGKLVLNVEKDSSNTSGSTITTPVTTKSWQHVAVTFDASITTPTFYHNGQIQASENTINILPDQLSDDLYIGMWGGTYMQHEFDGQIDEVRIYSRILEESEIEALARCNADINDSDLVAYWSFDEGTGQTVHDSSGNGNDGYLGNNPIEADIQDPNWVLSEILPSPDYYVDDDGPNDPGPYDPCVSDPLEDGSAEHPFDSIQEAIDQAYIDCNNPCSECNNCCPVILVRDGWYAGAGNYNIDTLGMPLLLKSENGPWSTTIDPFGRGRGFTINKGESECTIIDGFLVFDGDAPKTECPDEATRMVGGGIYCQGGGPTIRNCIMLGNYAADSGGALYLYESDATIYRCEIMLNSAEVAGAGIYSYKSNPTIQNCVVSGNFGDYSGGISSNGDGGSTTVINCTISDNYARHGPDGLQCSWSGHADVKNSIFWTDTRWWQTMHSESPDPNAPPQNHIFLEKAGSLSISYSDIEGGWEGIYLEDANCTLDWGIGNLNTDPLFTRYFFFDYHLKSGVGRWSPIAESNGDYDNDDLINFKDFAILAYYWRQPDPPQYVDLDDDGSIDTNDLEIFCSRWLGPGDNTAGWLKDDVNSPCLDAGEPNFPYALEPNPNGAWVNMGAYGNTDQASMTSETALEKRTPDLNDDGGVDFKDFALFAELWLTKGSDIPADFDYSNSVDYPDLVEFCHWWLWGKP